MNNKKIIILFIFLSVLLLCTKKSTPPQNKLDRIIAIVENDTIYVDDFIKRCEYTIRPDYCQQSGYHDKNICLNSLIAEKLFALEAGEDNELTTSKNFQMYIQGLKEQLMREELVRNMVIGKIKIPDEEIRRAYFNSQKIVSTEGLFIPDHCNVDEIYNQARQGTSFDELSNKYPDISKKVLQSVKWGHIDEEAQNAIFSDSVKSGTVLSPLRIAGGYRLIKVIGWTETIELSEANKNMEMENVKKRLLDYYIRKDYTQYVQDLMKGKRIDFFEPGWNTVLEALRPVYLDIQAESKPIQLPPQKLEKIYEELEDQGNQPLMKIDGKVWRINDFKNTIQIHPLEMSTTGLTLENFPHQLRASIASLIVDEYLTEQAYEKQYDQLNSVNRTIKGWKTYFNFEYHRDQYLAQSGYKEQITKDYFEAFDNYLTPYFERLKLKYNDKIRFNPVAMAKVQLTNIPMISHKTKGPYWNVVPPFPLVTNSIKTNYKRFQMETELN